MRIPPRLVRHPWGAPARWWLTRAVRRDDQAPVDALWADWLADPTARAWELFAGWNRPASGPHRDVSRLALAPDRVADPELRAAAVGAAGWDHPLGVRIRQRILDVAPHHRDLVDAVCAAAPRVPLLTTFCVEHGLAPADPPTRAAFFLLTDQPDHHRALDPDGTLLAAGYGAAPPDTRRRLRERMANAGDLDLVRVVVADRNTPDELAYVADQLTGRRDWPALWRLATTAAPAAALRLAASFPASWRPAVGDQGLYETLRAAPGPLVLDGGEPEPVGICGEFAVDGTVLAVGFSRPIGTDTTQDGFVRIDPRPELAVVTALPGHDETLRVGVYQPSGTLLWSRPLPDSVRDLRMLAHLLPVRGGVLGVTGAGGGDIVLVAPTGHRTVATRVWYPSRPLARPGGYACATGRALLLGDENGDPVDEVSWDAIRVGPAPVLAVDPVTGTMAVAGSGLALLDATGEPIDAHPTPVPIRELTFAGADRLLTRTADDELTGWRITAGTLRPGPTVYLGPGAERPRLAALAACDRIIVDRRRWLDADTLARATPAGVLPPDVPVVASVTGEHVAVQHEPRIVHVHRVDEAVPVADLADTPLAVTTPADLHRVERALRRALRPEVTASLTVLRALLAHRFAADVALTPHPRTPHEGDLALGDPR